MEGVYDSLTPWARAAERLTAGLTRGLWFSVRIWRSSERRRPGLGIGGVGR